MKATSRAIPCDAPRPGLDQGVSLCYDESILNETASWIGARIQRRQSSSLGSAERVPELHRGRRQSDSSSPSTWETIGGSLGQ